MDNDSALKKWLVKQYRNMRLKLDYCRMHLLSEKEGNSAIALKLNSVEPFMVGRFGAVEMHCVSRWMHKQQCTDAEREQALYAAGIFPNDDTTINTFCKIYTESMKQCDLLGVWEVPSEKEAILKYCPNAQLMPSRAIEPYYYDTPWSEYLAEKKVLIIHPFVESIKKQLLHSELLWPGKKVLPRFKSVCFLQAVQSNAGGQTEYANWSEALESTKEKISDMDFDVAIVGAGAYGLPLAAYCKKLGKQAIQMSGATQILFGIKGKRWDAHPVISGFYNEAWIRPSDTEKPPQTQKVEGGSYW